MTTYRIWEHQDGRYVKAVAIEEDSFRTISIMDDTFAMFQEYHDMSELNRLYVSCNDRTSNKAEWDLACARAFLIVERMISWMTPQP